MFYSALNDNGPRRVRDGQLRRRCRRHGAGDPQEADRRRRPSMSSSRSASNFFYTVTLPVTLWFLDRGKRGTEREDKVLFIDARKIFRQIDRAHRDWLPEQIEFLANIARLYRGEERRDRRRVGGADVGSRSLMASMPMCRACAPLRRLSRSRSRAGASTPAGTSVSLRRRMTASTSACGWRTERGAGEAQRRGRRAAGADRGERRGAAGLTPMAECRDLGASPTRWHGDHSD